MDEESDIKLALTLCAIFFGWSLTCGLVGSVLNNALSEPIELTVTEKRNIAIDFMAEHNSWKFTLCNMPMDGGKK